MRQKKWREKHADKIKLKAKKYREKNKDKLRQHSLEWSSKNKDKIKQYTKNRNKEKTKIRKQRYHSKKKDDPCYRLNCSVRSHIFYATKQAKNNTKWINIVGYSVQELRIHLESLFVDGMSWDNYGKWHIDHIRPVASFDFSGDPFGTAKECWQLDNLQPLWAIDNIKKGAKWQSP